MNQRVIVLFLLLALLCINLCSGKFTVIPPQFSNNAVLQRDRNVVLFGLSDAPNNTLITLQIVETKETYQATVVNQFFMFTIGPHAAGGPYTLQLKDPTQTLNLFNYMFGDVWVCSGQSNMVRLVLKYRGNMKIQEAKFLFCCYFIVFVFCL